MVVILTPFEEDMRRRRLVIVSEINYGELVRTVDFEELGMP
jgi:hypothetical protein